MFRQGRYRVSVPCEEQSNRVPVCDEAAQERGHARFQDMGGSDKVEKDPFPAASQQPHSKLSRLI